MNNATNNIESKAKICGILVLLGAAINVISLFTLVRNAFRGESPYAFAFLLRNLACISGFTVIGVGIFNNRHTLFKAGLFTCAAAFLIDAFFPLKWINENTKYYGSLAEGLKGGNFIILICYLAAVAGFVLMGILFSEKKEWQFPKAGTIAMICIAAYIFLTVCYGIYYMKEYYVGLWEYLSNYISGSSSLSIVGATGVLLMPAAFSEEIPKVELLSSIEGSYKAAQVTQSAAVEPVSAEPIKDDTITILRKYKQLLDMDIITQEEFDAKKKELL